MGEQEGLLQVSSISKGIIGGGIEMVKSIGPLEGMSIGATFWGPIGAGVGFGFGVINMVGQFVNPNAYSNIKKTAFAAYDAVTNAANTIGNVVMQSIDTVTNVAGNSLRYVGVPSVSYGGNGW